MEQELDFSEVDFAGGRFRPLAVLGRGSMGVVYRVRDAETDTEVALKTLQRRAPEEILTLKQEFRSLADIAHQNLVELYELFVGDRACFFTMEFVDGADVVSAVRDAAAAGQPLGPEQMARLVDLLRQLAHGLAAVHRAGKLHRDVKPSNIYVDRDGRLVLMDFGLSVALRGERGVDSTSSGGGTMAYMAPEQAWGRAPHPSADWYSTGVLLYELLTGRLPFSGPVVGMFQAKSRGQFEALAAAAPWAPRVLIDLTTALLEPEPSRRPSADDIAQALETRAWGPQARLAAADGDVARPFVGREAEMAALRAAAATVRGGEPAVVEIRGASGIGKSELVRRFVSSLDDEHVLLLRGRCHPQESIAYKALDPILDELSRFLAAQPRQQVDALSPDNTGALVHLFPVLGQVPSFADSRVEATLTPAQLRRRGFLALRQLLSRLGQQRFLVIWIDDLQWSDADSALLLRELLRPPGVPRLLLLLTYRDRDGDEIPLFALLREEGLSLPHHRRVALQPLSAPESEALLQRLSGDRLAPSSQAAAVRESHGSPFFLAQVASHLSSAQAGSEKAIAPQAFSLAEMLRARRQTLSDAARALLEVVSIAGRPLPRRIALGAAGLDERQRPLVLQLERGRFVRTTGIGADVGIETYHDRIRESVLADLSAERGRECHRGIAAALRHLPDADPEQLFGHYDGAGDREEARRFGEEAAERAARALAFDRAAALFRRTLELHDDESKQAELLAKLAEVLGNSGRGVQAGETYDSAAATVLRLGGDSRAIVPLKGKAAHQYLRVGSIERGVKALRPVLEAVGVVMPASRSRTLARAAWQRTTLWRRGRRYALHEPQDISPMILYRLEACWGSAPVIAAMDPVAGDVLLTCHMRDALDAGHAGHIVRALAHDAVTCSQFGFAWMQRRVAALLREASELAERTGDVTSLASCLSASGMVHYQRAEWRKAHEVCDEAVAYLRRNLSGMAFEIATVEHMSLSALAQMGDLRGVAARLPACLADAADREDIYSTIGFHGGLMSLVWLADDRADEALHLIEQALSRWPGEAFHVQHYLGLLARVPSVLYVGDARRGWAMVDEIWPRVKRSGFLRVDGGGVELDNLRGRAALAAALAAPPAVPSPAAAWTRTTLLAEVDRCAGSLERRRILCGRPFATLLRAGAAAARGRTDDAVRLYGAAAEALDGIEMSVHAAAARMREGTLRGGEVGRTLSTRAADSMRAQGITRPERMVGVFAPA